MAPGGKRFFHKPENLSSIPRTLVKKMLLKAHLCNPNTGCGGRRMPRLAGVQVEQEILCARAREGLGRLSGSRVLLSGCAFPALRVSEAAASPPASPLPLPRSARTRGCVNAVTPRLTAV